MDSNQLQQFRVIAEEGSITKAANELYITQPALSIALSKLENEIGTILFVRDGKKLSLTEAGKKLYDYAVKVTDLISDAENYFSSSEREKKINLFRIGGINFPLIFKGCSSIEGAYIVPNLVENSDLLSIVESEEADIVIADDRYLHRHMEGYICEPLFHQSLLFCCKKNHPFAEKEGISIKDLQTIPIIGHSGKTGFNSWIDEIKKINRCFIREEASLSFANWFQEGEKLALPYIMNNFGISTVWEVLKKMKIMPITGKYTRRDIYIWYREDKTEKLSPVVEKIKANVEEVLIADKKYLG